MIIELLNKIYNDHKQGLVGLRSLYEKANELRAKNDPPITLIVCLLRKFNVSFFSLPIHNVFGASSPISKLFVYFTIGISNKIINVVFSEEKIDEGISLFIKLNK
jgi:hypothetical protein